MKRAALALLPLCACFNLDSDFENYCRRTGLCDGGVSTGGGTGGATGGGSVGGGSGGATGGGSGGATGGGTGGATGGGSGGGSVISTDGGCSSPSQCTSPLNGTAACNNGACDFNCNNTFHRCNFSCVGNFDPNACGPSCMSCPNPMSGPGVRACDAGVCDFSCPTNYHRCGDACLQLTSTLGCGASCQVCNVPTGANAFCDAGSSCDFNCGTGFVKQNGRCVAPPNITFTNLADLADPNTYLDARLDPSAPSTTLWALDFSGQVLVSNNFGLSFAPVCRLPGSGLDPTWSGFAQRTDTRLLISPGPDRTAYVTSGQYNTALYRADNDGGAVCRTVGTQPTYEYGGGSWAGAGYTAGLDGTLWAYTSYGYGGRIQRSSDRGATWVITADAGLTQTYAPGLMSVGPDGDLLLTVQSNGLYLVTDAGTVVTRVSAVIYANDMMPRWSFTSGGYAFAGRGSISADGYFSMNGGRSWMQSPLYAATGDWSVDRATGSGYRFLAYDAGLNLERASDLTAPVWARTGGYWGGLGQGSTNSERVDAIGGNVVVVAGQRLYVSSNSGTGFTRVGTKGSVLNANLTLDSDGTRVLLAENHGVIYESLDLGHTYAPKYATPQFGNLSSNTPLVMYLSLAAPQSAVVRSLNGGPSSLLVTRDAFNTASFVPTNTSTQYYAGFAWAPATPGLAVLYGSSGYAGASLDGGESWASLALAPALPFSTLWQATLMRDPTYGLAFDCSSNQKSYRVNNVARTTSEITSTLGVALGGDPACAAEVYSADGGAALRTRVISRTGWVAVSDDDGATFNAISFATGGLTACSPRRLTSPAGDRNTIVTWCNASLHVSRNSGVAWTDISAGQNWARYGCNISSLYALQSQLLITCDSNRPPIIVDY